MKVLNKQDCASEAYLAAVAQAAHDSADGEAQARQRHQLTRDCAGGRFAIDICRAYCQVGLNGTQFLSTTDQKSIWDSNVDRNRFFGQQIKLWETWETSRDRQLAEWTEGVELRLRARDEIWTNSDRALAARLISLRHAFVQATVRARQLFFVTKCGEQLGVRLAARAYLVSAIAASNEQEASLVQALRDWTCSRCRATSQLSERERRNYVEHGLAGGEEIASYDADFRRKIDAADKALDLAGHAASKIQGEKIESARLALNLGVGKELVAPLSMAQTDEEVADAS
jgi:hypothetical protein